MTFTQPLSGYAQSWPSSLSAASSSEPAYAPVERYFQPASATTKATSAAPRGRLLRDGECRVQHRTSRDSGEDSLVLQQLPRPPQRVVGADGVPPIEDTRVVQLGHEPLVEVPQPVYQLAVARLGRDDLHV